MKRRVVNELDGDARRLVVLAVCVSWPRASVTAETVCVEPHRPAISLFTRRRRASMMVQQWRGEQAGREWERVEQMKCGSDSVRRAHNWKFPFITYLWSAKRPE